MIKVQHQTISDSNHADLVARIEAELEVLRKRGDKILAVMPLPLHDGVMATIFYEVTE